LQSRRTTADPSTLCIQCDLKVVDAQLIEEMAGDP
jgi:hypothetical protein